MSFQRTSSIASSSTALITVLCTALSPASVHSAQGSGEVDVCLAAHEEAHVTRDKGDMLSTRDALRRCADEACPDLVRKDCVEWLADVARAIPTVVVVTKVDGEAATPRRFWIDDVEMDVPEDAIELNPGTHVFRGTDEVDGELLTREVSVLIHPGVRRQEVMLDIAPDPPPPEPGEGNAGDGGKRLRLAGFATLGIGAAAGISALGLGVSAIVDYRKAEDECAPFCDESRGRSIDARFLAADVMGPIAGALLVTSAVLLAIGYRQKKETEASGEGSDDNGSTLRRKKDRGRQAKVTPVVSPNHIGVHVRW